MYCNVHIFVCVRVYCVRMWRIRRRRKRLTTVTKHYTVHKELARELVHQKLVHWNQFYGFQYGRVSIRNQRTCWGSCSSNNNLNFNYKILFLPEHLQDYLIVHELCHLKEFNHSKNFWMLVEKTLPEYKDHKKELRNHHLATRRVLVG